MSSLYNDGPGDGQWTLVSTDIGNNKQPNYKTNVINGLPTAEFPIQNNNTQNALMYTQSGQSAFTGDFAVSMYCVAQVTVNDSNYRPLWAFGNPNNTGGTLEFGVYQGNWLINGQNLYQTFGAYDNNFHVLTVIKSTGAFFAGVKFYIDGVLQTPTNHGSDQTLSVNYDRFFLACYNLGSGWNEIWQGNIAELIGYNTAHNGTDQAAIENILQCKYFNINCLTNYTLTANSGPFIFTGNNANLTVTIPPPPGPGGQLSESWRLYLNKNQDALPNNNLGEYLRWPTTPFDSKTNLP